MVFRRTMALLMLDTGATVEVTAAQSGLTPNQIKSPSDQRRTACAASTRCWPKLRPLNQHKLCTSERFFDAFHAPDDSDPATSSASLTMSALSFMNDAWARTANGGLVSIAAPYSATSTGSNVLCCLDQSNSQPEPVSRLNKVYLFVGPW